MVNIKIKKEELVKLSLGNWFNEHGFKVWFEKKNSFGFGIFHTIGSSKKPDMIIEKNEIYAAIEVKSGKMVETIMGGKVVSYYNDYSNGVVKYLIDNKEIKISYFLLSNEHSINGSLVENDTLKEHKEYVEGCGYPKFEYEQTKNHIRSFWRNWTITGDRKDFRNIKIGYGVVLSSYIIDKRHEPMFFVMKFDNREGKKKWKQSFSGELYGI